MAAQEQIPQDTSGQLLVRIAWAKRLTRKLSVIDVKGDALASLLASTKPSVDGEEGGGANPFLAMVLSRVPGLDSLAALYYRPGKGELTLTFTHHSHASTACTTLDRCPIPHAPGRFLNAQVLDAAGAKAGRLPRPRSVPSTGHPPLQGLTMLYDFVSPAEQASLLEAISAARAGDSGNLSRRVVHYGYCFDYARRAVDWTATPTPIPPFLRAIADRLMDTGLIPHPLDQVTVNDYAAGQGIAGHLDNPKVFDSTVVSLSLAAPLVMTFERAEAGVPLSPEACPPPSPAEAALPSSVGVWLPPTSAMVITGRARYAWSHGITKRKTDVVDGRVVPRSHRISITFRRVIETPSDPVDDTPAVLVSAALQAQVAAVTPAPTGPTHAFDVHVGAAVAATTPAPPGLGVGTVDPGTVAPDVEREHVHKLYNAIAKHFSGTRHSPWPSVKTFLNDLPEHSIVFDLGCGNGKYLVPGVTDPAGKLLGIGADISTGLTDICGERGLNAITADGLAVPLRSGAADASISIAVLHHLSTPARRAAAVAEVLRVLRPGGAFMIQAWALEQGEDAKRVFEGQDVMVPWKFRVDYLTKAPAFAGAARPAPGQEAEATDVAAAWGGEVAEGEDRVVFQRYCHVYKEGELEALVGSVPGAVVKKVWWERGNWLVTGVKAAPAQSGAAAISAGAQGSMWARKAAAAAGCIAGLSYGPLVSAEEKGAVPPPAVPSFLDAVGNTPLIELRGLSKATGCRIYGKAEYLNPGGSVKDRAAAGMIAAAEASGQLVPAHASPDGVAHGTIVEGTGGNTGLALALAARSRGYTCILTVPDRITAEKKDSMRLFGATLIECPSVPFSDPRHFFHEASRLAAATPGAVWTDQFNNAANWGAHYSTTGPEIWAQTGGQVDAVALASGTGGTIGGLATFFSEQSKDVAVFLVDPPGSSLKGLLDTGAFLPLPGSTITEGIGTGRHTLGFDTGRPHLAGAVAVRDADAVQMAHFLLSQEGIFVGPAAAMNAMGAAMVATKLGPGHTIVTILCDSGDKYRSTVYSQAYLQDRGLEAVASAGADGTLPDIGSALAFSESNPQPRKE